MKSVKQISKRAFSPITGKTLQTSEQKKKSKSNYPNNPYRNNKQFDSYANKDKKRTSNYIKNILTSNEPVNKYRIVTEPVDDRFMNIVNSTFLPSRSRPKIDHEQSGTKIRQASTQKRNAEHLCSNCQRLQEEISNIRSDLIKIIDSKNLWKNGQTTLDDIKHDMGFAVAKGKGKIGLPSSKIGESSLTQIKKHFLDLMRDIQSLSQIDYPKMLSHNIFNYEPRVQNSKGKEEDEIKSLLSQLRSHYDGKVTAWDLEDNSEESDHIKAIIRNLKSRLSHYLRENLELKTSKAILEKAQEISLESEEYLRHLVESVLVAYSKKI